MGNFNFFTENWVKVDQKIGTNSPNFQITKLERIGK